MFVDQVLVYCQAGDGGNGCVSFRREPYVPRGGPDGGDGGDGGSVIVVAEENVNSLANIAGHRHWNGERGTHGQGQLKTGRRGKDAIIRVPPGTLVKDAKRGHTLKDLKHIDDRVVIAKGGKGGKGNKHFATSTNQAPRNAGEGARGEYREVVLELKLIADVGLIGKPNAGKSTLLSRLSKATPEIADYPFTTKYPNLGLVQAGYDHRFVLADIPGLIEGAHSGIGLGHEFLKHVERTRILVHLVEPQPIDGSDPIENYRVIHEELRLHDPQLIERTEIICVTKSELPDADAVTELLREELDRPVMKISAVTGDGLSQLVQKLIDMLAELNDSTD